MTAPRARPRGPAIGNVGRLDAEKRKWDAHETDRVDSDKCGLLGTDYYTAVVNKNTP